METSFKKELRHFSEHQDSLLNLTEFDIRNNVLKLFKNLGWNVYNEGLSPFDYEVLHEATISSGRPDLTFQIGGDKKFFIETKKTSIQLGSKDIWQTWKYAWNSGLNFSIISNFLQIWIIDCRATPPDKPPTYWKDTIIKKWDITRYLKDFPEIKSYLGKNEVQKGSLLKLENVLSQGITYPTKLLTLFPFKGSQPVDNIFLNQIDFWRLKIAKNLYSRSLSLEKIVEQTDNIINFLVFTRVLEDRALSHRITLREIADKSTQKKGTLLRELSALRSKLDDIYNGSVFKEGYSFNIDEAILIDIIDNLYPPQSPYQFNYISVDILGTIYERFLGKKLSANRNQIHYRDDIASKTAQKESGVFYTERYITNFMVNQVLRKTLKPNNPESIFDLRIADITCGSGSFLISAYKYLIFWFERICNDNSRLRDRYLERRTDGLWKLRIDSKVKLLENCIYGIDIDPEAIDVSKFSLYLQLLEDESEEGIKSFFNRMHKPILPILDDNIKCGNSLVDFSLIEEDFYSKEIQKHIDPFDLRDSFKEVFDKGGFDIIVGNPPYNAKLHETEKIYCKRYALSKGNFNSANLFIERVDTLTKPNGSWILIVPKSLIYSEKWISTRKYLNRKLFLAVDASKAFKTVKLEQVIIGCEGKPNKLFTGTITKAGHNLFNGKKTLPFTDILPVNISNREISIGKLIHSKSVALGNYFKLLRGIVPINSIRETGDIKVYQGKYIQGFNLLDPDKGISEAERNNYSHLLQPKLMFQQIVSHTLTPFPHIRLIGSIDLMGDKLSVDTVSNIFLKRKIANHSDEDALLLCLAVLNSRVMSWFVDRFIYAKAIRTMHFDNYHLNKMRFPTDMATNLVNKVIRLVNHRLSLNPTNGRFQQDSIYLEKKLNNYVAELFGLSSSDITFIDKVFGDEYYCNMGRLSSYIKSFK